MNELRFTFSSALLLLSTSIAVSIICGYAHMVQIAFLPLCLAIGIWTFSKSPYRNYITFVIVLWVYAPFVRRLVDWQLGRTDASLIILTPYLVSVIALISVMGAFKRQTQERPLTVTIIGACFAYGLFSGLLQERGAASLFDFLAYTSPLVLAAHLLNNQLQAQQVKDHLTRILLIHATIVSVYGIAQFLAPAPWDIAWMIEAPMASIGEPIALQVRVFSTMNAPAATAIFIGCALLLLLERRLAFGTLAALPMSVCLWLTLVRSSWLGVLVGLTIILVFGNAKHRTHLLNIGLTSTVVIFATAIVLDIPTQLFQRLLSLGNLQADVSFATRTALLFDYLPTALNPLGHGLGSTGIATTIAETGPSKYRNFDNGMLDLVFTFGWVGVIILATIGLYILMLIRQAAREQQSVAALAGLCALATQLPFFNPLTGTTGVFLFLFGVLALPIRRPTPQAPPLDINAG